MNLFTIH